MSIQSVKLVLIIIALMSSLASAQVSGGKCCDTDEERILKHRTEEIEANLSAFVKQLKSNDMKCNLDKTILKGDDIFEISNSISLALTKEKSSLQPERFCCGDKAIKEKLRCIIGLDSENQKEFHELFAFWRSILHEKPIQDPTNYEIITTGLIKKYSISKKQAEAVVESYNEQFLGYTKKPKQ